MTIYLSAVMQATSSMTAVVSVAHAHAERDWRRRWDDVQREFEWLRGSHSDPEPYGVSQRLRNFFVDAFHIRDDLIHDQGWIPKTVDDVINAHPDLAARPGNPPNACSM